MTIWNDTPDHVIEEFEHTNRNKPWYRALVAEERRRRFPKCLAMDIDHPSQLCEFGTGHRSAHSWQVAHAFNRGGHPYPIKEVMPMMTPQERGQKAARSRTFKRRWLEACDGVKKRGLLIHEIKAGQRGAELAALDHYMRSLNALVTELQMSNVMPSE